MIISLSYVITVNSRIQIQLAESDV